MNPTQSDYQLPPVDDAATPSMGDAPSPSPAVPPTAPPAQSAIPPMPANLVIDDSGLTAEDVDLIEKAWVEKAKAIVRSTEGDPYAQNKELNKIKADYIKKRYNRDIKVN